MKITRKHIDYINTKLAQMKTNNISINLPNLTDKDLEQLRKHFKTVRREFLGYVYFAK